MRLADAPPPGWYPDPAGTSRLRWWEGTDWSDHYRARPSTAELEARAIGLRTGGSGGAAAGAAGGERRPRVSAAVGEVGAASSALVEQRQALRRDTEDIITEVRKVARSEVDRAADLFSQRARMATRELQPLITQYSTKLFRWLRVLALVVVVLLVGWVVFQVVVQQSLFDWIGDRIDNLSD